MKKFILMTMMATGIVDLHGMEITAPQTTKDRLQSEDNNTNLCPRCKAPMKKNDDYKHVLCTYRKIEFCWKCLYPCGISHNESMGARVDGKEIIEKCIALEVVGNNANDNNAPQPSIMALITHAPAAATGTHQRPPHLLSPYIQTFESSKTHKQMDRATICFHYNKMSPEFLDVYYAILSNHPMVTEYCNDLYRRKRITVRAYMVKEFDAPNGPSIYIRSLRKNVIMPGLERSDIEGLIAIANEVPLHAMIGLRHANINNEPAPAIAAQQVANEVPVDNPAPEHPLMPYIQHLGDGATICFRNKSLNFNDGYSRAEPLANAWQVDAYYRILRHHPAVAIYCRELRRRKPYNAVMPKPIATQDGPAIVIRFRGDINREDIEGILAVANQVPLNWKPTQKELIGCTPLGANVG